MERRAISIRGLVQGVGFRPFVHRLATRLDLRGFVRNQTGGVLVEVEGDDVALDRFLDELSTRPPPTAEIDAVRWTSRPPRGDPGFRIEPSDVVGAGEVVLAPDVAVCDDCLAELFDPRDRRFRYPFLSCARCGPRFTIIRGAPYDRERTTMASFPLCGACRAEYHDPADRRFHAEATACPACGPRLSALDDQGRTTACDEPLAAAVATLRRGGIVAIKGLGGYHLACVASDARAVAELRCRKRRDAKPFAIMVRDTAAARLVVAMNSVEEELLTSRRRPIVLLRKLKGGRAADAVAPGARDLGVMLPYTPLHALLTAEFGSTPLVMTSGNLSDEPIAYEDDDARARLAGVADLILTHDRPIRMRCDDSVTRVVAGREMPVRRARGDAPRPLELPIACERPVFAAGGQMKATFALGRGRVAVVSHHLGDLDHYEAYRSYAETVAHYERLFDVRPEVAAHDLHPDYASTRFAIERHPGRTTAVQHHHAHVASCMAEHGLDGPVIGVAFDGSGYGADGAVWGGEVLVADYTTFRRAAHLRYVAMPGGEQAIREPWRQALAHLEDAAAGCVPALSGIDERARAAVSRQVERGFNAPMTSSVGRLFDAVAAIAGVRTRVDYEGQAAIELEALATDADDAGVYPFAIEPGACRVIDTRPLIAAAAEDARAGAAAGLIARRFHATLVEIVAAVCARSAAEIGLRTVVLSGGVFMNALLTAATVARLERAGFRVCLQRRVPTNDGGLALGQLAVAAARLAAGEL